jgi:amino acid permease
MVGLAALALVSIASCLALFVFFLGDKSTAALISLLGTGFIAIVAGIVVFSTLEWMGKLLNAINENDETSDSSASNV